MVNQKSRKDIDFPLGVLDVLSLPTGENFRLLYDKIGKFVLKPIKNLSRKTNLTPAAIE